MRFLERVRRQLGVKLFLSYLIIIVVGVVSLLFAAQLSAPNALARHAARMAEMLGTVNGSRALVDDLNESFAQAVSQILLVAAGAAVLTALLVSTFVTRRLVGPIQRMKVASQRIAAGEYGERIEVVGEDELGTLARSFNQMARQLEETEARRRQLIGDVTHELRTPLASMRTVLEGLIDGVLPADPATLHQVEHELVRLQRLVQDLEALSRAEAGQLLLERRPVDPGALITDVAARLRPQYEDKGVALAVALPRQLPAISADKWRVTQVMTNLLGNALQYTPEGGQVTVTASRDGDQLVVQVADTGIGIAVEDIDHIFERFYRVDKSRSRAGGGSGIGLTIARHLVEAHGGEIWVESAGLGKGTSFTFTMPVEIEQS
ncbi:MAG: ATP-binding protein [Anaerolineae bacterium]|nr:ATP-binding protein [Anaerolineae bacterium]